MNKVSILISSLREQLCKDLVYRLFDPHLDYEVVVVSPFRIVAHNTIWIEETVREGNVKAMQRAYEACTGDYIIFLADDVEPWAGSINEIYHYTKENQSSLPFLAAFDMFNTDGTQQHPWAINNMLYACYGCISRKDIEKIGGFFDTRYYHSWCDPDLAMRVWMFGGKVKLCKYAKLINKQIFDDCFKENQKHFEEDKNKFIEKMGKYLGISKDAYWESFNKEYKECI
jgi:GT2 family glycosyltransferase